MGAGGRTFGDEVDVQLDAETRRRGQREVAIDHVGEPGRGLLDVLVREVVKSAPGS